MTVTAQAAPPVLERNAWSDARERVDPSSATRLANSAGDVANFAARLSGDRSAYGVGAGRWPYRRLRPPTAQ